MLFPGAGYPLENPKGLPGGGDARADGECSQAKRSMSGELLLQGEEVGMVGAGAERWMRRDFSGPTKHCGPSWVGAGEHWRV